MDIEASLKTEGYFTAYLYQGLSHYILGTYYGRGPSYPSDGGATLNESAFIQSSDVIDKVSKITPVPGGVGPMTIAMLVENTIEAAEKAFDQ